MASVLFSPFTLRDLELPNRIAISSMCQYIAKDGSAHDWHLMHLGQFAVGGAGLLMIECTHVSPEGRITPGCLGLWDDDNERALKRVIDFCRTYSDIPIGIQLGHAGRKGSCQVPLDGGKPLGPEAGSWTTLAPSAVPFGPDWHTPKALDRAGLDKVRGEFVAAAERAVRIGFDLMEFHCGHGYLLHQFLSPLSNQRTDEYGGDIAGRMRFPLELFEAVRAVWPAAKPMGIRVSATDWVDGGWTPEETVAFAKELKALGCDYIDVTTGGLDPRQQIPVAPGFQVPFSEKVRKEAGIPTMSVGLIAGARQAERIVAEGKADMVALARAMMYDPRWSWHAAAELGAEIPFSPMYARCNPSLWPGAEIAQQAAE